MEPKYYSEKEEGIGYIYEVDLEYPDELHDLHNDYVYPCAPEKICVRDDILSDYCKEIKDKFKIGNSKVHKLIPALNDKERYVLHEKKKIGALFEPWSPFKTSTSSSPIQ